MDSVEFLFPRGRKLLLFLLLLIVFVVRWSDNVNTLNYQCDGQKCAYEGELLRHVGFPFNTYKVYVNQESHYNYFYDFNFVVDLGVWYLAACVLDFLLGTAMARKTEKAVLTKIEKNIKVEYPDDG